MTTATSSGHPVLVRPFDAASGPPARVSAPWLARLSVRRILAEIALLLGILALTVSLIATRFVFHAGGAFAPPLAVPVAIGAAVAAVLAFIASTLAQDRG